MQAPLEQLLRLAPVRRVARGISNWVDLPFAYLIEQLHKIAPTAKGRLLDVGCGDKPYEHIFRPYVTEYLGIEYSGTFDHTAASGSGRASKPDLYYDGKTLPFPAGSFDTVICMHVLEHTPHPQGLMNEIGRVVRKDGLVIVGVPFSFRLHEEPFDFFRYTAHGLTAMFDEAGLAVEGVWTAGDLWSVLAHKINSYLAFRVARIESVAQSIGKLGHEAEGKAPPRYWSLPLVLPTMGLLSAGSRVLDRIAPDGTETLSYLAFGRPRHDSR
jgi:SAM-dependent methyltransferase